MVRRDRHDITIDILRRASTGKRKTELMSDVGLSYMQTKQYLKILIEKKMLELGEDKRLRTTKKGTEFLERCNDCLLFPWEKQRRQQL